MPIRRGPNLVGLVGSLVVASLLVLAAVLALGQPDTNAAADFVSSARPSHDGAVATVEVIVWAAVAALALLHVVSAVRHAGELPGRVTRGRGRARLVLVLGLLIFCGGALNHLGTSNPVCCGDMTRADRLAR